MGLLDFQVVFEKPWPTFFPGETVNGQLIINLSSVKDMQYVKVSLQSAKKSIHPILNNYYEGGVNLN